MKLHERESLPDGFLDTPAEGFHSLLGGPTLIHLPGEKSQPLFLSILLHGDETTGVAAVQSALRQYETEAGWIELPRALSIFIGNTEAAQHKVRRLDHQPDFNRVWSGGVYGHCPEQQVVQQVTEIMRRRDVFASVDIHNNTGRNPHYGCVNALDQQSLSLAGLFSDVAVYFLKPAEVQSMAFTQFCTAITVECGQVGERDGVAHATEYISKLLSLESLDQIEACRPKALYHTTAIVKVQPHVEFAFGERDGAADITFRGGLEDLNFNELPAGALFANVTSGDAKLSLIGEEGQDVTDQFILREGHELTLKKPVILSMFTTNRRAVRQDCLCYFMEHYPL